MVFNKPDPAQFRAALVKADTQWQKTYGSEAWTRLEQYTGPLTRQDWLRPVGMGWIAD
jgi:hypothetical protein